MAWTYGFFNSVNGDRLYNANQMSSIFEGLVSSGVYESVGNKLAVQPNSGMTIQVATGRGYFAKHWVNNDAPYLLTLEGSDVVLNRYCAVIVKVDESEGVRSATVQLKYGDFATNPVKPTITRSTLVNEYCLAYIYIKAKATSIKATDIEDARQDKSVCGWVTGLIDQITPDTLYTQFTAQFNEWFNGLQDIIDADVETRLVNALPVNLTVTIPVSAWTDNTAHVTVNNMNATKSVLIQPHNDNLSLYSELGIKCISQTTNELVFSCETIPEAEIKVNVIHMGV